MSRDTIRFWEFVNGSQVRFQLSVGTPITYLRYKPDSEGYSREWYRYEYDGNSVIGEMHGEGRDCDGYHVWESRILWDCKTLVDVDGVMMPKWTSQYQFGKELSGY